MNDIWCAIGLLGGVGVTSWILVLRRIKFLEEQQIESSLKLKVTRHTIENLSALQNRLRKLENFVDSIARNHIENVPCYKYGVKKEKEGRKK